LKETLPPRSPQFVLSKLWNELLRS